VAQKQVQGYGQEDADYQLSSAGPLFTKRAASNRDDNRVASTRPCTRRPVWTGRAGLYGAIPAANNDDRSNMIFPPRNCSAVDRPVHKSRAKMFPNRPLSAIDCFQGIVCGHAGGGKGLGGSYRPACAANATSINMSFNDPLLQKFTYQAWRQKHPHCPSHMQDYL
jgi:hypothetical protein